jgi:hypothetical protein
MDMYSPKSKSQRPSRRCLRRRSWFLGALMLLSLPIAAQEIDQITRWNTLTDAATATLGFPPQRARGWAMTQIAVHDALNAIEPHYQSYHCCLDNAPGASKEAAVAVAAYTVLSTLVTNPDQLVLLQQRRDLDLAGIADGVAKEAGKQVGTAAANAILAQRAQDGAANANFALPPYDADPGIWVPTPSGFLPAMLPGWGNVTPFAPGAAAQYRPDALAGLDLTSPQYAHDYNEVKTDGAAAVRAADPGSDKSVIARFWYEASPSGWNRIARVVSDKQPMEPHEKARLYALVNIAIADGYIASWESKYDEMFWRPVTAIRRGNEDGRDDTVAETQWLPYLNTPQMPDYTSGHAVAGAAVAKTMAMFFGSDAIPFGVDSGAPFAGLHREFTSFSHAARENADSRVYAGIHFRTACDEGLKQGKGIGRFVFQHYLQPLQ